MGEDRKRLLDEGMSDPDEWVTIAEGARLLKIDQKQVRRYAARLADTDRTPANVSPVSVRLSAIVSAREAGKTADRRRSPPDQPTDTDRTPKGQSADSQQDSVNDMSAQMLEILRDQLTVKDAQLAERDAEIRALIRVVDEDRNEIRKLQARLAIPQAPATVETDPPASPVPRRDDLEHSSGKSTPAPRAWWKFWGKG